MEGGLMSTFNAKNIKTITREEAAKLRREAKDHTIVVEDGYAIHFVMKDGVVYVIDEAVITYHNP